MQSFEWVDATKLSDALSSLNDKAMIKAGGIDVLDRLKEGLDSPTRLVNIRNIRELKFAADASGGLRLGPLMTLTETAQHPLVKQRFPALAEACAMAATPQIRNVATIGGNILQRPRCWYFRDEQFHCLRKGGDRCFAQDGENDYHAVFDNNLCAIVHPSAVAVVAVAYGAIVQLTSSKGKREVPLESIFVRPERRHPRALTRSRRTAYRNSTARHGRGRSIRLHEANAERVFRLACGRSCGCSRTQRRPSAEGKHHSRRCRSNPLARQRG